MFKRRRVNIMPDNKSPSVVYRLDMEETAESYLGTE